MHTIYICIFTFKTYLQDDQTTLTDGVGVVGAASPCDAVSSAVVGPRSSTTASSWSPAAAAAPRRRAISRSRCTGSSSSIKTHSSAAALSRDARRPRSRRDCGRGNTGAPQLTTKNFYFSRTLPVVCCSRARRRRPSRCVRLWSRRRGD